MGSFSNKYEMPLAKETTLTAIPANNVAKKFPWIDFQTALIPFSLRSDRV